MTAFTGSLRLRALEPDELRRARSEAQLWELLEPLTYQRGNVTITVPVGFTSDFASIPRFAKWYVDDDEPDIVRAAVVHDFIYSRRGLLASRGLSRGDADAILKDAMLSSGASETKAFIVWAAVRLGGGPHWNCDS